MQATESCRNFPTHGNRLRTLAIVGLATMGVAYGGLWLVNAYPDTTVGCYVGESSEVPPVLRGGDDATRAAALQACACGHSISALRAERLLRADDRRPIAAR